MTVKFTVRAASKLERIPSDWYQMPGRNNLKMVIFPDIIFCLNFVESLMANGIMAQIILKVIGQQKTHGKNALWGVFGHI